MTHTSRPGSGDRHDEAGRGRQRLAPLLPGGEPVESLLRKAQFFVPGTPSGDYREVRRQGGRGAEEFYRERWRTTRWCARRTG
jgi:nitrate reductase / nitrite oxidoreductase, alpha subunit